MGITEPGAGQKQAAFAAEGLTMKRSQAKAAEIAFLSGQEGYGAPDSTFVLMRAENNLKAAERLGLIWDAEDGNSEPLERRSFSHCANLAHPDYAATK